MGTTTPHHHHTYYFTTKFISKAIYILIPLALLHFYLFPLPIILKTSLPPKTSPSKQHLHLTTNISPPITKPHCNYTQGKWVPSQTGPLYNGTSCSTIKPGQNCMAHGRPDTGYLHWRWQPDTCKLRHFDPLSFLKTITNKHLAFVGDSMARNQLESLLCLLSTQSNPQLVYKNGQDNKFRRWVFAEFNATVSVYWSPFLVNGTEKSAESGPNHNKLYVDSADTRWAGDVPGFDIVVFSIGHWFLHPAIFYENGEVLGCHHCPEFNHTEIGFFDVFRKAVRTSLKEVGEHRDSNKLVVVTTFSPAHFEGEWDKAGACNKKEPYREGEKEMEYMDNEMRKIEVEEVAMAKKEEGGKLVRIEALDVTRLSLMRPDGHPGPYMNPNPFGDGVEKERVQNDCVHWCLPGPVDTWNEILLEMVERWADQNDMRSRTAATHARDGMATRTNAATTTRETHVFNKNNGRVAPARTTLGLRRRRCAGNGGGGAQGDCGGERRRVFGTAMGRSSGEENKGRPGRWVQGRGHRYQGEGDEECNTPQISI